MSKSFKDMWNKILHPSISASLVFYLVFIVSTISSVIIIVNKLYKMWYSFIIFFITFVSLCYSIYLFVLVYKFAKSKIKVRFQGKKSFGFLADYNFTSILSVLLVFIINVVFSVFLGSLAIMSRSLWYGSLTIYYVILSINRGSLLLKYSSIKNKNLSHVEIQLNKAKTYRNSGMLILLLTLALAAFVIQMVISPEPIMHADILIYPVTIYTAYKIALAIKNIFKAKKYDDTVVQASRNINLATAIVSLLTLQVNMFQVFVPDKNMSIYNGVLGGFTCIFVIVLGIYMIVNGNRKINNFYNIAR